MEIQGCCLLTENSTTYKKIPGNVLYPHDRASPIYRVFEILEYFRDCGSLSYFISEFRPISLVA